MARTRVLLIHYTSITASLFTLYLVNLVLNVSEHNYFLILEDKIFSFQNLVSLQFNNLCVYPMMEKNINAKTQIIIIMIKINIIYLEYIKNINNIKKNDFLLMRGELK